MTRRQFVYFFLIAFFIGAIGSIAVGRFLIPYLSTTFGWESLNKLATNSPIVVTRTQEIQLNEGVNLIDLTKQAGNMTVSIYSAAAKNSNPNYLGNGIVMTGDGLIFTSKTILNGQSEVMVVLNNGNSYKGLVRAVDPKTDIAAITINQNNLSGASFADSLTISVGQRILIMGPSNIAFTRKFAQGFVTNTVLNATTHPWRTFTTELLEDTFETDAVVNTGEFIGSPVINLNGRVIGMVTGNSVQKLITSENLQTALHSYLSSGKINRPVLGVTYFHLSKSLAPIRGLDRAGVLVAKVDDGSPASGKILVNDLIFEVDGQNIENLSFEQVINQHAIGDVRMKVLRAGKEVDVNLTLTQTK